jgi:hypothetical protein
VLRYVTSTSLELPASPKELGLRNGDTAVRHLFCAFKVLRWSKEKKQVLNQNVTDKLRKGDTGKALCRELGAHVLCGMGVVKGSRAFFEET